MAVRTTTAAVLREPGRQWEIAELELDEPRANEVLVRFMASGLYRSGDLKLDELITQRYRRDEINDGYRDLMAGKNIRGVIIHEH
jgi:Zn-dependent alcohol dehydrogenase